MIQYQSTRGQNRLYLFSEAILKGIASDGGLFVPEKIPHLELEQLRMLLDKSYQERASFVFNLFETDFPESQIKEAVSRAYANNFDNHKIAPLIQLKDNQYLLELWHGPTSAFKDMALQIMPLLFEAAAKKDKSIKYLVLTATSGDTGKAALEGFKNRKGISIAVFYPKGLVSKIQALQMNTQDGGNVLVSAVKSDFDGVQKLVKELFGNQEFSQELINQYATKLSSANSINWGRLMSQIIYHISGYLDLVGKGVIELGQEIDIAVPTGNFGNILAAFYAKKMGLPIRKLICASNENKVLSEFLETGVYDIKNRKLIKTPSPSMDILVASNIERLLYELSDSQKVSSLMGELKETGRFEVDEETKFQLQKNFYAGWVSNNECLENIKKIFDETDYLMDPHTSVAQSVTGRYLQETASKLPVIICSTAHWAKFGNAVFEALFPGQPIPEDEFAVLQKIQKINPKLQIPKAIASLEGKNPVYANIIEANVDQSEQLLKKFLGQL